MQEQGNDVSSSSFTRVGCRKVVRNPSHYSDVKSGRIYKNTVIAFKCNPQHNDLFLCLKDSFKICNLANFYLTNKVSIDTERPYHLTDHFELCCC